MIYRYRGKLKSPEVQNPPKQGLKLDVVDKLAADIIPEVQNPPKQGLKPNLINDLCDVCSPEVQNPPKQGLKH